MIIGSATLLILLVLFTTTAIYNRQLNLLKSMIQAGDASGVSKLIVEHPALLNADLQPDRHDKIKPLSFAAGLGQEAICSNLLVLGEDVNEVDKYHYTPLHQTILPDETNVAILLIKNGANISLKDFTGLTPLDMAKKYNASSNMIKILSEAASFSTKK